MAINYTEVENTLENIIKNTLSASDIKNYDIRKDYQTYMDSIKFLMLISRIEKKFNIEITFEDLQIENVSTFSALANTIYKYLK